MFFKFVVRSIFVLMAVMTPIYVVQANASTEQPQDIENKYQKKIREIISLGELIYQKDKAAWLATDELRKHGALESGVPLRGWVTEEYKKGWRVTFVGEKEGKFRAFFAVQVKNEEIVSDSFVEYSKGKKLTKKQNRMFLARQSAMKSQDIKPCSHNYNTVVLPKKKSREIDVYLLAASTRWGEIVFGGHYRVTMSKDGKNHKAIRSFTNTCLTQQLASNAVAVTITHLTAPTPEEIHVFLSIQHKMPVYVYVSENDTIWKVENSNIELLDSLPDSLNGNTN